jgi:hypothetical protein
VTRKDLLHEALVVATTEMQQNDCESERGKRRENTRRHEPWAPCAQAAQPSFAVVR